MYVNASGSQQRTRKERKVSLIFRNANPSQHCSGIESLAIANDGAWLFTASRDSTIKRWNVANPQPTCEATFEAHIDWVNDIALVHDILISCSSDRTVKAWKATAKGTGSCLHTFSTHSDYVTCLAAAPAAGVVASAGLRSEIFLHDLAATNSVQLHPPQQLQRQDSSGSAAAASVSSDGASDGPAKGSVYALAITANATLLAAGTTQSYIRVMDPRTRSKVAKLKGHTDNVRALVLSADGCQALSASSDGTIKLWDIGQQRCVQTLQLHSDSVWCLATPADGGLGTVYSGGRDGRLFCSSLQQRTSELCCVEGGPVRSMALCPQEPAVWVATPSSSVHKWSLAAEGPHTPSAAFSAAGRSSSGRSLLASSSPATRLRRTSTEVARHEPAARQPAQTIAGAPGIVLHKVLNDRRHILTKDSSGEVALWDVLEGCAVQQYGQVDFTRQEAALWQAVSVPQWFSSDHRTGCLALHLEAASCFAAEAYALSLGLAPGQVGDDVKFNYGVIVLRRAFQKWAARYAELLGLQLPAEVPGDPLLPLPQQQQEQQQDEQQQQQQQQQQLGTPYPRYHTLPAPPAVVSTTAAGVPWRITITQFNGREKSPDELPGWVSECVLEGKWPAHKELKTAFELLPAEGSGLPSLLQSRLNAPRILEVKKVAHYCQAKLAEEGIQVATAEVTWDAARNEQLARRAAAAAGGQQVLQLTCCGMLVPYDMSLASVKKFIWRRPDEVHFVFSLSGGGEAPQLPQIGPPA